MKVRWKVFTNCSSEVAAGKVGSRYFLTAGFDTLEFTIKPRNDSGFLVSAMTECSAESWPQAIVHILTMAQAAGRAWMLCGNITDELDIWSNDLATPGVTAVHIMASSDD